MLCLLVEMFKCDELLAFKVWNKHVVSSVAYLTRWGGGIMAWSVELDQKSPRRSVFAMGKMNTFILIKITHFYNIYWKRCTKLLTCPKLTFRGWGWLWLILSPMRRTLNLNPSKWNLIWLEHFIRKLLAKFGGSRPEIGWRRNIQT